MNDQEKEIENVYSDVAQTCISALNTKQVKEVISEIERQIDKRGEHNIPIEFMELLGELKHRKEILRADNPPFKRINEVKKMRLADIFKWGMKKRKLVRESEEFMISESAKQKRTWHGKMTEKWMADFAAKKIKEEK